MLHRPLIFILVATADWAHNATVLVCSQRRAVCSVLEELPAIAREKKQRPRDYQSAKQASADLQGQQVLLMLSVMGSFISASTTSKSSC